MADKRNHPIQSRISAKPHQPIISGHFSSGNFSVTQMVMPVVDMPKDNRPTLHKGDAGDFVPIGEIERIQNGNQSPPLWW